MSVDHLCHPDHHVSRMQSPSVVHERKVFSEDDLRAVESFRQYIRVKTMQPKPDYSAAMEYLQKEADHWGLEMKRHELVSGKYIAVMTWPGCDPSLPSIVLNSHMDVVPYDPAKWRHDPFGAEMDEHQNIYGRGTQDMKSVGYQHLEAVGRLKRSGATFRRTIHILYMPDEEIGGFDGMQAFIKHGLMAQLNPGLVLDEGIASPTDRFTVFYGERALWWVRVKTVGNAGHGSRFIENTAMERLVAVINRLLDFRGAQKAELEAGASSGKKLGDVTTVNLTYVKGGVSGDGGKTFSINVIPTEAEAGFDIRIPPHVNLVQFRQQLQAWTSDCEGVSLEFIRHTDKNVATSIEDDNPFFAIFKDAIESSGHKIDLEIFPAGTDSKYIRNLGIPAFGFSPMNHTPVLLHDHDEYINASVFVEGIQQFVNLIPKLADATF